MHPLSFYSLFLRGFGGGVLEDLFEGDFEDVGYAEGYLERGGVFIELDGVDGLAGDGDGVGEVLLGEAGGGAEVADGVGDSWH